MFGPWCNGSTEPFGGSCLGSNPGGPAKLRTGVIGSTAASGAVSCRFESYVLSHSFAAVVQLARMGVS